MRVKGGGKFWRREYLKKKPAYSPQPKAGLSGTILSDLKAGFWIQ